MLALVSDSKNAQLQHTQHHLPRFSLRMLHFIKNIFQHNAKTLPNDTQNSSEANSYSAGQKIHTFMER
jgi:hypothetical protein